MSFGTWITKVINSIGNFVSGAVKAAPTVIVNVEHALETAAQVSSNLVNALKSWIATPTGTLVKDVIETVVPAQWIEGVLNFLPTILQDLGWAQAEFNKSPAQIVQDGITYATSSSNPNVVATNLATLAAHINTHIGSVQGVDIPIQASLSQAHVVYLGLPGADTTVQDTPNA
jgi:hypothetical protein